MSRYINADKLEKDLKDRYEQLEKEYGSYDAYVEAIDECIDKIENAPTADVQEVKHGKWIFDKDDCCFVDGGLYCSNCERYGTRDSIGRWVKTEYCPNCGAKMDGDE